MSHPACKCGFYSRSPLVQLAHAEKCQSLLYAVAAMRRAGMTHEDFVIPRPPVVGKIVGKFVPATEPAKEET